MIEYDVVVVGAGILGVSTAYHIKKMHPNIQILVVDKHSSFGQGNTARSAAAFRCIFSSPINSILANASVDFYNHMQVDLGVDLQMKHTGYLWLLSERDFAQALPIFRSLADELGLILKEYEEDFLIRKLGLKTDLTNDADAQSMGLESVCKGILFPKAGVLDNVDSLVEFYVTELIRMGGTIQYRVEVENLIVEPCDPLFIPGEPYFWQDARIAGVKTNIGVIRAKKTVLASGAWIPQILDAAGIECCIKPRKRQFFTLAADNANLQQLLFAEGFNDARCLPFVVLPTPRVYIRPFYRQKVYWVGYADEFPRSFQLEENPQPEKNFYEYGIYQVLTRYFPHFKNCRPISATAGLYQVNILDGKPVVFEVNDLIVVGGASGSGLTKADALGRVAAALYDGAKHAFLYGGKKLRVSDLGLDERNHKSRSTTTEGLIL